MSKVIKVVNDKGIPFNVRLLKKGDKYGRNFSLVHDEDAALVEFYDARQDPSKFTEYGQFVSRYYLKTLKEHAKGEGLLLDAGIDDWQVSGKNMDKVKNSLG